jgi:hypothetical protein
MRRVLVCLAVAAAGCAGGAAPAEWEAVVHPDRRLPGLLDSACLAFEQRRYDAAIGRCDDALAIFPDFEAASLLREFAGKSLHTDDPFGTMTMTVRTLRSLTDAERGLIPRRRVAPP